MHKYKLIKFNIEDFYPSITERLQKDALNFANITTQKKSLTHQNMFYITKKKYG